MNCKQLCALLDELPVPEWSPGQLDRAEEHTRECPDCGAMLMREKEWTMQWQAAPDPEAPAVLIDSVMAQVAARRQSDAAPGEMAASAMKPARAGGNGQAWATVIGLAIGLGAYLFQLSTGQLGLEIISPAFPQWRGELASLGATELVPLVVVAGMAVFLSGFISLFAFDAPTSEGPHINSVD